MNLHAVHQNKTQTLLKIGGFLKDTREIHAFIGSSTQALKELRFITRKRSLMLEAIHLLHTVGKQGKMQSKGLAYIEFLSGKHQETSAVYRHSQQIRNVHFINIAVDISIKS